MAVIADVHGNLPALEAVVADIVRRNVDVVINLGDHASGPLWPRETVALLMQQSWTQISGNCDRAIVQHPPADHGASDRFAFERLTVAQRDWLAALPPTTTMPDGVFACHGTPFSDETYLLETVEGGRNRLASRAELVPRLGGVAAPVVLCAHSHIPRVVRAGDTLIVNPGSVGLPAYDADHPEPHIMETGSPDARYAILERSDHDWRAALVALPYDHAAAVEQARRNARPDWERGVGTGYMTA